MRFQSAHVDPFTKFQPWGNHSVVSELARRETKPAVFILDGMLSIVKGISER